MAFNWFSLPFITHFLRILLSAENKYYLFARVYFQHTHFQPNQIIMLVALTVSIAGFLCVWHSLECPAKHKNEPKPYAKFNLIKNLVMLHSKNQQQKKL